MLLQDAKSDESAPDFFAAFPGHGDTPRPHDSAIPASRLRIFGFTQIRRAGSRRDR